MSKTRNLLGNRPRPDPDAPDCGRSHACQFCPLQAECRLEKSRHETIVLRGRLAAIKQIVLVLANKGGVGKSTVAANLAAALARKGHRVGVADADIHGPNQSRFFGFVGKHVRVRRKGVEVCKHESKQLKHPIGIGSLAFLMESDDMPIVWRDAYKHDFIHHLVGSFDWGALDFLVVDMPPGTGNELITLTDLLEGENVAALLVTTPQEVALMDTMKALNFCRDRSLPLLGLVENMAGVTCPHCNGAFHVFPRQGLAHKLAAAGITPLAQIPLEPALAMSSDHGTPDVLARPDGPVAKALAPVVQACTDWAQRNFAEAAAAALTGSIAHNLAAPDFSANLQNLPEDERAAVQEAFAGLVPVRWVDHEEPAGDMG